MMIELIREIWLYLRVKLNCIFGQPAGDITVPIHIQWKVTELAPRRNSHISYQEVIIQSLDFLSKSRCRSFFRSEVRAKLFAHFGDNFSTILFLVCIVGLVQKPLSYIPFDSIAGQLWSTDISPGDSQTWLGAHTCTVTHLRCFFTPLASGWMQFLFDLGQTLNPRIPFHSKWIRLTSDPGLLLSQSMVQNLCFRKR